LQVRFPVSLEFFIDIVHPAAIWVVSASNRHEYQDYFLGGKGGRCVGLTTLPLSCADDLEIWEPQATVILRTCPDMQWDYFNLLLFLSFYLLSFAFPFHLSMKAGKYLFFFYVLSPFFFHCFLLLSLFSRTRSLPQLHFTSLSYLSLATSFNS
jgi:hypothetical protein